MTFEFATAGRIRFGPGVSAEVGALAAEFGSRALLVRGGSAAAAGRVAPVRQSLQRAGLSLTEFDLSGEPTIDLARRGAAAARAAGVDLVVGCGGGSVLDAGKAIAALATNPGDPLDYLEVIGRGQPLTRDPLPLIALPTTAGTGSEVTRNAVLGSAEHGVKASLRHARMLPRVALVDPELTAGLPPAISAACGLDALTQLIEPLVSTKANPIADALARAGLPLAARALPRVCRSPEDPEARGDMALASLLAGLAMANAGLGAVHGFAAAIGGAFTAPHGAVCAALLAPVTAVNLAALRARGPADRLARYDEAARLLTGSPEAVADDAVTWLRALTAELAIAPLAAWGVEPRHHADLATKAARANSMKANPLVLTSAELRQILETA
jgi:alcohol dehydrogenase class IV